MKTSPMWLSERRCRAATGMAWTAAGGDILFIEATKMKGKGNLKLSGSLGDVMKESVGVASSYIKSAAVELGIDPDNFDEHDIHIHVPSGAIPKDGPSAGVTMLTAIVSLFTGIPVDNELSMTGEATLRGAVLLWAESKRKCSQRTVQVSSASYYPRKTGRIYPTSLKNNEGH